MKITLLISTFNSTSQLAYTYLKEIGHDVAINDAQMIETVNLVQTIPNLV